MVLIRYILYFIGIGLVTALLAYSEISAPGGLNLHLYVDAGDTLGTSEYSPVEWIQHGILLICGLFFLWVANHCPQQRPIAYTFAALALIFLIRELDYFLDRLVADNFWQAIMAVVAAGALAYIYRNGRRFRIAWLRIWPSPGITLMFAGFVMHFAFILLIGHEPLWEAILGDNYVRIAKVAIEEFMELMAYYLWLVGTIEYTYQARAIATREPQPAVAKRRDRRQSRKSGGRY